MFARWRGVAAVAMLAAVAGHNSVAQDRNGAIVIAAAGPMTGSAEARGKDLEQAVRMAVDEANAAGGVNGKHIAVDVYDDGDDPSRARDLAMKIAGTSALAVLGQMASSAGFAAGQIYKEQQIPAITGAASEARVTKGAGRQSGRWPISGFAHSGEQGRGPSGASVPRKSHPSLNRQVMRNLSFHLKFLNTRISPNQTSTLP